MVSESMLGKSGRIYKKKRGSSGSRTRRLLPGQYDESGNLKENPQYQSEAEIEENTRRATGRSSSRVKVTPQDSLTNEEVIAQNEKLLTKIEEERQQAKAQGNDALYNQLTQQYNDIARVSNEAVKEENEEVYRARASVDFANLYAPTNPEKAKEIIQASGVSDKVALTQTGGGSRSGSASDSPPVTNRFYFDQKSGLWIDTQAKKEVFQSRVGLNAQDTNYYVKNSLTAPRSDLRRDKDPLLVRLYNAQEETEARGIEYFGVKSSEYQEKADLYFSTGRDVRGLGAFGVSFVLGAGETASLIGLKPEKFALGVVNTFTSPIESTKGLIYDLQTQPARTLGGLTFQTALLEGAGRGGARGVRNVREARFNYKLNKNLPIDEGYIFKQEGTSAVSTDGTILRETQTQLYPEATVRYSETTSSLKPLDSGIQTPLNYPTEGGFFTPRYNPGVETVTLEGGKTFSRASPKPQEVLSYEAKAQRNVLRGTEKVGEQTDVGAFSVKSRAPGDTSLSLPGVRLARGEIKGGLTKFESLFKPSNRLYAVTPGAEAVSVGVEIGSKLFDKFDEGRAVNRLSPEVSSKPVEVTSRKSSYSLTGEGAILGGVVNPNLNKERLDAESVTSRDSVNKQENPLKDALTDPKTRFIIKADIREGYDYLSKDKITSKDKSDIAQKQDTAQFQDTAQDITPFYDFKTSIDKAPPRSPQPQPRIFPRIRGGEGEKDSYTKGYDVLVRKKGLFQKENLSPLSRVQALNFGYDVVDKTASASFKLVKSNAPASGTFKGIGKAFNFYKKNDLYIEKASKRINTPGEKEAITFKGIFSKKLRRGNKIKFRL